MNSKYSEGYLPKIKYWLDKITNAESPLEQVKAVEKVRYFHKRQVEVYGHSVSLLELYCSHK
jgi:hypothetical protein